MTNTQYFYIKLKKDFFSDPKIFALESEKNGFLYNSPVSKQKTERA